MQYSQKTVKHVRSVFILCAWKLYFLTELCYNLSKLVKYSICVNVLQSIYVKVGKYNEGVEKDMFKRIMQKLMPLCLAAAISLVAAIPAVAIQEKEGTTFKSCRGRHSNSLQNN